jgi:hypothetical protein
MAAQRSPKVGAGFAAVRMASGVPRLGQFAWWSWRPFRVYFVRIRVIWGL